MILTDFCCSSSIANLNIVVKYDYKTENGHWVVTGYRDSYKMDRAHFKFSNLFGGNKQLGKFSDTIPSCSLGRPLILLTKGVG